MMTLGTNNGRIPREHAIASSISKFEITKFSQGKIKEGDKVLFFNEKYKERTGVIEEIFGEVPSAKPYFKVYDVILRIKDVTSRVYCVYFGLFGKICLRKDVDYELFDLIIDDDELPAATETDAGTHVDRHANIR